ncbi:uncharacterized protein DEA37_0014005 [Paragonimus westermani]|uniref:Uncharacterized protein n=1 Tax=Paragonimus westermani TaxID=34504 RepID=A0A5J4NRR2_9TREM|nr:uncharacterized protein DEA37_0014005 [Paragonimus westermani]
MIKAILVICLVGALFAVYAQARPDESSRAKLRESLQNLRENMRMLVTKVIMKARERVDAWLERDGLGEKLSEILQILMNRLNERINRYLN